MTTKEIRKKILEILYRDRSENFIKPEKLVSEIKITEEELDNEIRYLSEKYYIRIMGEYMGKRFLNFSGLKITADGVDLVEDPDEFNKLFTFKINNFSNLQNSNVNIESNKSKTTTGIIEEGQENYYENIETEGFDVGIHNKGKKTNIVNYKSVNNIKKKWFETWWGITILTVITAVIAGFIIYKFGWN